MENIVYNELIARGYEVYIGKTDKGEIDCVIDDFGERIYIQVADYLSSNEVVKNYCKIIFEKILQKKNHYGKIKM